MNRGSSFQFWPAAIFGLLLIASAIVAVAYLVWRII